MKMYIGYRKHKLTHTGEVASNVCEVLVNDNGKTYALNPRFDIRRHSPTGFEWGYCGSGPAQLALALCADHMSSNFLIEQCYQYVKRHLVANLPHDGWQMTEVDVANVVEQALNERYAKLQDEEEG